MIQGDDKVYQNIQTVNIEDKTYTIDKCVDGPWRSVDRYYWNSNYQAFSARSFNSVEDAIKDLKDYLSYTYGIRRIESNKYFK